MKLFYMGIIILPCVIQYAHAEEATSLDEVTVTARPIGLQSIEHIAQPINILNKAELAKRQSSSIGETLSNVPDVTTNRFSPLVSRPIIRGLGGSRVLVLENGISSMDVSTISADHAVTMILFRQNKSKYSVALQPCSMAVKLLANWLILSVIVFLIMSQTLIQKFIQVITATRSRSYSPFKPKGVTKNQPFTLTELNEMPKITTQKRGK